MGKEIYLQKFIDKAMTKVLSLAVLIFFINFYPFELRRILNS